jgi:hypothetical protein
LRSAITVSIKATDRTAGRTRTVNDDRRVLAGIISSFEGCMHKYKALTGCVIIKLVHETAVLSIVYQLQPFHQFSTFALYPHLSSLPFQTIHQQHDEQQHHEITHHRIQ